eukprot:INCI14029.7.p1 GENE.INCI14029.7~~INCI14029.7.p1  ORF type:complete len:397 (-),score=62.10 INCI14029.7:355-1479(-)
MPRAGMSSARAESKDGAAPPPERKRKDAKRRKSKRRAHKVLDAPKTNFIGFETSFELGTFSVVWQRILDSLMREGSRFARGEEFCAVQKLRLFEVMNCHNIEHRFLAMQTFKPTEFERFARSGRYAGPTKQIYRGTTMTVDRGPPYTLWSDFVATSEDIELQSPPHTLLAFLKFQNPQAFFQVAGAEDPTLLIRLKQFMNRYTVQGQLLILNDVKAEESAEVVLQLSVCDVKDKRVQEKHVAKIKKFEQDLHEYLGDILDVASCGFGIYRPVEAHPKDNQKVKERPSTPPNVRELLHLVESIDQANADLNSGLAAKRMEAAILLAKRIEPDRSLESSIGTLGPSYYVRYFSLSFLTRCLAPQLLAGCGTNCEVN